MTVKTRAPRYVSTTIQKALDVLTLFKHQSPLSFTEIGTRLRLHKSTLFRILHTLEVNQYLARGADGKYVLGLNLFILGNRFSRERHIQQVATPYLTSLSERLGMTVHLGILEGTTVVILQKIDPSKGITMLSRVGAAVPAHCTGQGKTLLAFSPRATAERILKAHRLRRFTANTITDRRALLDELRAIRERGYTVDHSEHENHIKCLALPILNEQGGIEAALSITGLAVDFPDQAAIEHRVAVMRATAERIRKDLGFC